MSKLPAATAAHGAVSGVAPRAQRGLVDALEALAKPPRWGFAPQRWLVWWRWWWRFGRHRRRVEQLRAAFPGSRVPDCANCVEHCCKAPALTSLRLADIARLHDAGLGWAIVPFERRRRRSVYAAHPELARFERQEVIRRFPVLKQHPDGRCVFVDEHNRCTIHSTRPAACRRFPALLGADLETVRWATYCRSHRDDPGVHAQLMAAVAAHHNAKLLDLWLLDTAWVALEAMGLTAYLPDDTRRSRARRFAAVFAAEQAEDDAPERSDPQQPDGSERPDETGA